MNEIYLEMQNGFKIYQNDLDMTLSNIKTITLGITIGVISAYVLFLIFLVKDLTKTHQDKIRFWNSLIKLDTLKSMSYKKMLHVIKENLENSTNHSQLKKSLMESKKHTSHEVKAKAKDAQANGFKRLKSYKLKNRSYFIVFPFLAVLLVILAYFITSEVIMGNEVDKKAVYMTEIINSETYYQINRLTLNGIYQLLVEGENASLTGSSITTIINQNLVTLSRLGDFIGSFRAHPYFDPKSFIQTSLCEMYIEATEKSECIRVAGGLNTQGLLGILTFLKTTLETLTDLATQSNGSPADITNALNQDSLIRIESNMKYIEEGFDVLINSLAESELKEQDTFQTNQIIILLVFIVLLGIINYFMVWKGFKRLDGQKFDNMKILRVIPAPMILESKMLKTYLLKSFKDDLSSITNKI